eukprot:744196-Rhodomonas_salina.2
MTGVYNEAKTGREILGQTTESQPASARTTLVSRSNLPGSRAESIGSNLPSCDDQATHSNLPCSGALSMHSNLPDSGAHQRIAIYLELISM